MNNQIYNKGCLFLSVLLVMFVINDTFTQVSEGSLSKSILSSASLPDTIFISQDLSGGTHEFIAGSSITANNVISNGAKVRYSARKSIRLIKGFKVNPNCSFRANLNVTGASTLKSTTDNSLKSLSHVDVPFKIYPNPNNGSFKIEINNDQLKQVIVFDQKGTELLKKSFTSSLETIQVPNAVKGIYMLKIIIGNDTKIQKIVVQ